MNKSNQNQRKRVVSSAISSVKAEGLKISRSTVNNLNQYAAGKISVSEMRQKTSQNVQKIITSK